MVLRQGRIGQWCSVLGGNGSAVLRRSGRHARGGRRGKCEMERRLGGQTRGGFKARLRRQGAHGAWPARSGERRRVADTRRRFSETVGHGD